MKRFLTILLCSFSLLSASAQEETTPITVEEVQQQLQQYDKSDFSQKLQICNALFVQYEEMADTLFHFDEKDKANVGNMDFLTWYWSGEYAYENDEFKISLDMAKHALDNSRQYANDEDVSSCLNLAAIACHRLADYSQSLDFATECLEVSRRVGEESGISSTLNTIAGIYLAANTPAQGIPYIKEAIEIERRLGNQQKLAIRLGMASDIYISLGDAQTALPLAEEALQCEIAAGGPNAPKVPVRKSQLASVYMLLKDYPNSERLLLEACDAFRAQGNVYSLSVTLGQLGHFYMSWSQQKKALAPLQEAVDLCQKMGNIYTESRNRFQLAWALSEVDPKQAYKEMLKYDQLRDSIYKEQMSAKLQEFDAKYEASQKQHQLDLQEEHLKRTHLLLIGVIIIAIIAVILLIFAFRLASVRKHANQTLIKASLVKDELLKLAKQETEDLRRRQLLQVAQNIEQMGNLPDISLTSRETQIVALYAQGLLSKEIANQLGISTRTVETHKVHIYRKLGINNNIELLRYAQANGLAPK